MNIGKKYKKTLVHKWGKTGGKGKYKLKAKKSYGSLLKEMDIPKYGWK